MPGAVISATYDASNELLNWNGTIFSYDDNGNMLSDGTNNYVWDVRNQLTGVSGGSSASFIYDAFGRRISKTVNGQVTGFLYNGDNATQELSSGSASASILNVEPRVTIQHESLPWMYRISPGADPNKE